MLSEKDPEILEIVEVSPRDGIQNEKTILNLDTKLSLIEHAIAAGARRIEVTSFVNPRRVPQMADADELMRSLPRGAASYIGVVMNERGFERAAASGCDEINFVVVASETFSQRNQGASVAETLRRWELIAGTSAPGMRRSVTIGAAFGCPFEGEVPESRLIEIVDRVMACAPDELALADTIGVASPADIEARIAAVRSRWPGIPLRLHLHNTRNTGLANAWAALRSGVRVLDASFAGAGGCPFAPRATGNIPTEDLIYMLERAGIATGYDLDRSIETAAWLEARLGHTLPGMVMKAGKFPLSSSSTDIS